MLLQSYEVFWIHIIDVICKLIMNKKSLMLCKKVCNFSVSVYLVSMDYRAGKITMLYNFFGPYP